MTVPVAVVPVPRRFTCYQYRMPTSGSTQSLRVMARDENGVGVELILKLRRPGTPHGHRGGTSLACELIFATVARALGLNVPDFGIAEVGSIFANSVTDDAIARRLNDSLGPNFGSVALRPPPREWDHACTSLSLPLRQAIDDVLAFDASIVNGDRRAVNPNLLWDGLDTVHVIDHGLAAALLFQMTSAEEAAFTIFADSYIQAHSGYQFLRNNGQPFDKLPDRWTAVCDDAFWLVLRSAVPSEWEQVPGDLDRLFAFLKARVHKLADMKTELRRVVR